MLAFTAPMLATSGRPPGALDGWVVEPKADGWRAQVAVHEGSCAVWTRTGRDITAKLPELGSLTKLGVACVLDGELVAGAGLPTDFYPLAGLVSAGQRHAVTFVAFDVLRLDGRSLLDYDLAGRREVLECLVRLSNGVLTTVSTFPGADVDDVLAGCEQLATEGVVLKRLDSPYRPGRRSPDWRKLKCPAGVARCARFAIRRQLKLSGRSSVSGKSSTIVSMAQAV